MYNLHKTAARIKALCDTRGVSINKMLTESGAGARTYYNILAGSYPSTDKALKIANYFDVSVDCLLGISDTKQSKAAKGSNKISVPVLGYVAAGIFIKSDLKFLVKRLLARYERTTALYPPALAQFLQSPSPYSFLNTPSREQYVAIDAIFNLRTSYIWGAPGTGKTKYVLANSIAHYVQNNCSVIVTAPTNNALEQILEGVIPVLSEEDCLTQDNVLRLGTPSAEFGRKYPGYCEQTGLQKQIAAYKHQISILTQSKEYKQIEYQCNELINALDKLKRMRLAYEREYSARLSRKGLKSKLYKANKSLKAQRELYYAALSIQELPFFHPKRLFHSSNPKKLSQMAVNLYTQKNKAITLQKAVDSATANLKQAKTAFRETYDAALPILEKYFFCGRNISSVSTPPDDSALCEFIDNSQRFITNNHSKAKEFFLRHTEYSALTEEAIDALIADYKKS